VIIAPWKALGRPCRRKGMKRGHFKDFHRVHLGIRKYQARAGKLFLKQEDSSHYWLAMSSSVELLGKRFAVNTGELTHSVGEPLRGFNYERLTPPHPQFPSFSTSSSVTNPVQLKIGTLVRSHRWRLCLPSFNLATPSTVRCMAAWTPRWAELSHWVTTHHNLPG